ncbi:MAG TPA: energy transducer TonB [Rhizomicrobium sp.]|nr:energy transducer TonB [Rhizomicrobium sp.]
MHQPIHAIAGGRREMTPERIVGLGFVGLLHALAIWAIVTGLGQKIVKAVVPDLVVVGTQEKKKEVPPPPKPELPIVELRGTTDPVVPKPIIDIEIKDPPLMPPQPPRPPQGPSGTGAVPDTAAMGIASTHTIPPYPTLERRLGHQGTVKLRLTISPQGAVTAAEVVQSSGFPGLDQAAVSWVLQHWTYKPATHDGAPVPATAVAAVVFNLRNGD